MQTQFASSIRLYIHVVRKLHPQNVLINSVAMYSESDKPFEGHCLPQTFISKARKYHWKNEATSATNLEPDSRARFVVNSIYFSNSANFRRTLHCPIRRFVTESCKTTYSPPPHVVRKRKKNRSLCNLIIVCGFLVCLRFSVNRTSSLCALERNVIADCICIRKETRL